MGAPSLPDPKGLAPLSLPGTHARGAGRPGGGHVGYCPVHAAPDLPRHGVWSTAGGGAAICVAPHVTVMAEATA